MRPLIVAGLLALSAVPAAAGTSCYVGIDAGKTITASKFETSTGPVTIAADGLQAGARLGCDYIIPGFMDGIVIGAYGGVDMQDVSTGFSGAEISSDLAWTAAIRGGVKINPGTLAYGLVGMSWTDISYPGATEISPRGYVYGAGLEVDIGVPNLSAYVEWSHTQWGKATDLDVTLRPDSDTVRIGLKLKFGATDVAKIAP